jgi:hypothetical protein
MTSEAGTEAASHGVKTLPPTPPALSRRGAHSHAC